MYRGTQGAKEPCIRNNLPQYADVYELSLGEDEERAAEALRKQLQRDVGALSGAGIKIEVEGEHSGRRYRLPPDNFSPVDLDLSAEERVVLTGSLRELRRDFPYSVPLHLAVANLLGAASASGAGSEAAEAVGEALAAAVTTREDEAVSRRVGQFESAVSRRKRVRFEYYSISRDEMEEREVEPYALSLLGGSWYVTGWDTVRQAVRQFRLSRIQGRVVFGTKKDSGDFEVPQNFERRRAGPRAPWQLEEPHDSAQIRVSQEAYRAARRQYGWAFSVGRGDDGGAVLFTPYSGERQLTGWVLSLGEEALALSPEPLVGRVVEGLAVIAEAHAPSDEQEQRA